ncbi:hypothetical protein LUZ60_009567 [Juncus effusus]|nr:hypothetical protein LUZ60_009567 [Juncus effusus]
MSLNEVIFIGTNSLPGVRPTYLKVDTIYTQKPLADPSPGSDDYNFSFSFVATSNSTAPPLLNAIEIFFLLNATYAMTNLADVDAIFAIQSEYKVNKGWSGDPCAPVNYTWAGIGCSFTGDSPKIISLNLSSSGLTGSLSASFSKLQNLKTLDLSNNKLNGTIPDFLLNMTSLQVLNLSCNSFNGSAPVALQQKSNARQITLKNDCNGTISDPSSKKAPIAVIVPVVSVALVVLLFVVFCVIYKRKLRITEHIPISENEIVRLKTKKYTKRDLEKITNNFARKIGGGGFGGVFFGTLTDGTNVAVKKLSETSTQGLKQFLTEAESLAMLHHRNMLSLLGYCEDRSCLALIYEYMSRGSLEDHIKGRQDSGKTLGWRERLHVVVEAAQGLDYLHRGGRVPIVHRDVKSSNILLGSNLEAKVSDLGLAKTFHSSTQKETNTTAICGTLGYIDPEYFSTGTLSEKSDVYSFGVVLLEIITGLSPVIRDPTGDINLVHYINDKIKQQDITSLVDKRFQGNFDIDSVWKVMELALSCTQEKSPPRPTMADVLARLLTSMELENLQDYRSVSDCSTEEICRDHSVKGSRTNYNTS